MDMRKRTGIKAVLVLVVIIFTAGAIAIAVETEDMLSGDQKAVLAEARKNVILNNYPGAEEAYREILAQFPDLLAVRTELGDMYIEQKDWDKAVAEYREIIFLQPDDMDIRFTYARILLWGKHLEEAQRELFHLYKNYPDREDIIVNLVDVYLERGEWKEAVNLLRQLIADKPVDVDLYLQLGRVLSWHQEYNEAIAALDKALELDPDNYEAKKEMAYIHAWTNKWTEAEPEFKALIEGHPEDQDLKKELADIYFYQERYQEAGTVYQQIVALNPAMVRQLTMRIEEINIFLAPLLSYNFFYYHERQKHTGISAENFQSILEYTWPLTRKLQPIVLVGHRRDRVVGDSVMFGGGFQYRMLSRLWIEPRLLFEPNHGLNPKNTFRLAGTLIPNDLVDIQMYDQYINLWNGNWGNSCGALVMGYFLKDRSLHLRYGLFYDWIKEQSDYFVRIDKPAGERLDKWTNMVSIEKNIKLTDKSIVTPGYSFSYDTTAVKRHNFYADITIAHKYFNVIISGSYGWDTDDYIYKTAGCYLSRRF